MSSRGGFDPRIENKYLFEEDDEFENEINTVIQKESKMKSFFKRADFPFFLLGAFILVLLIFIVAKLPEENSSLDTKSNINDKKVDVLSESLSQIRKDLSEIKFEVASDRGNIVAPSDDFVKALNALEDRFDKRFALLESKIDSLSKTSQKSTVEKKIIAAEEKIIKAKKPHAPEKTKPANVSKSVKSVYHDVKKGDTLYSISRKYNVSVDQIKKNNKMQNNAIHPGEKLLITK